MTEADAIQRNICPSPFADCLAHQFAHGSTLLQLSTRYKINLIDAAVLIRWALTTKLGK